jgi:hypothetical protein
MKTKLKEKMRVLWCVLSGIVFAIGQFKKQYQKGYRTAQGYFDFKDLAKSITRDSSF